MSTPPNHRIARVFFAFSCLFESAMSNGSHVEFIWKQSMKLGASWSQKPESSWRTRLVNSLPLKTAKPFGRRDQWNRCNSLQQLNLFKCATSAFSTTFWADFEGTLDLCDSKVNPFLTSASLNHQNRENRLGKSDEQTDQLILKDCG